MNTDDLYVLELKHWTILFWWKQEEVNFFVFHFQVLMDMFEQDELVIYHHPMEETSTNQTYGEVIKDLIMDEKQYLRDLQVRNG